MVWPGDAQMLLEWNMMINDNRGMEADPSVKLGRLSAHRMTMNDRSKVESISPYEFTRAHYPNCEQRNTLLWDM